MSGYSRYIKPTTMEKPGIDPMIGRRVMQLIQHLSHAPIMTNGVSKRMIFKLCRSEIVIKTYSGTEKLQSLPGPASRR